MEKRNVYKDEDITRIIAESENPQDLMGAVIDGNLNFTGRVIGNLILRGAIIEGDVILSEAAIWYLDLIGAKVKGNLILKKTRVKGILDISQIVVEGDFRLWRIKEEEDDKDYVNLYAINILGDMYVYGKDKKTIDILREMNIKGSVIGC